MCASPHLHFLEYFKRGQRSFFATLPGAWRYDFLCGQRAVSNDNAIVFTDGRYKLRLCAYAPNIMRVTQTGHDEFILRDDPMIVAKAEGIAEVAEAEGGAVVDCGELMCRINLNTGALEWFCSEGDVVGTEIMREPGKGRARYARDRHYQS